MLHLRNWKICMKHVFLPLHGSSFFCCRERDNPNYIPIKLLTMKHESIGFGLKGKKIHEKNFVLIECCAFDIIFSKIV